MAKKKYETINIDTMTGDVVIDKTKNNTLDFNGKTWAEAIDSITSDGDNLVITTTNEHEYAVILTDYFAKNGKHSIKYINTSGAGESDLALVDIVNARDISGASQIITQANIKKGKLTGTVFNDTITGSELADKIYGNGGNDTIDGGKGNDAITGGAGTNTILLYTTKSFGNDTVTLTKGEHLYLKLADTTNLEKVQTEIVGKDLVITVNKGVADRESSVTIKNYTKKDVLTSAGEFLILDKDGEELFDFREEFSQYTQMDADHYNKSSFTGTWIDDEVDASDYVTTVKQGKTEETTKGVTINLGGASYDNVAWGSKYADTIKGGANDDNIIAGRGNDNITGGAGYNTLYYSKGDGHDTVTLTKGERLELYFEDLGLDELHIDYANKNKDVKIWYADKNGDEAGSVTIKNFGKKDPTDFVIISDKDDHVFDFTKDFIETKVNKTNFTGTFQNDFINASESEELIKKNKHVNMVLSGGKGKDYVLGSNFADTLKGGDDNDELEGGKGDDLLYGEKGENTIIFNSGDGKDTVYSGKGTDTLKFVGDDNGQALLTFDPADNNKDLIIHYGMDRTSTITIKDYYKKGAVNPNCSVKYIQIGDNEPITVETAKQQAETEFKDVVVFGSGTDFDVKAKTEYVIGSDGNDNPDLSPSTKGTVSVSLGKGNDTVTGKDGTKYIITGDDGNKTITTSYLSDEITIGDGTHTINAGGGNNVINAGDSTGNSTITTTNGNDTITVGDGNYDINAGAGLNNITAGDGNHTITTGNLTGAEYEVIKTGDGNNTITTGNGQGNRNIETGDGNQTITTGESDDIITVGDGLHDIKAGRGANTITAGDNTSTEALGQITTGYGNDTITVGDGGYNINAGEGNNTIVAGNNTSETAGTVTTENGNDSITVGSGLYTINDLDGENTITATGDGKKTITIGDEDNHISYKQTISTGTGDDEIKVYGSANGTSIESTGGNNTIYYGYDLKGQSDHATTITTGAGNDTIYIGDPDNHGGVDGMTIDAGDGNNTIYMGYQAKKESITTGSGNDKIYFTGGDEYNFAYNSTINAGGGDNEIEIYRGHSLNITTGDGNDTITKGDSAGGDTEANKTTINAGAGNNTITMGMGTYDITTGDGNQTITTSDKGDKITVGDGKHTINAGAGNNTIVAGNNTADTAGTITTGVGNDTITVGSGLYTITDAGGKNTITATGDGKKTITIADADHWAYTSTQNISTGTGDDEITVYGFNYYSSITSSGGNNTIWYGKGTVGGGSNDNSTITTGAGNDTIKIGDTTGGFNKTTVNAGDGDNTIEFLYGNTSTNTVTTGNGNNTVTFANNIGQTVTTGSGNDTITMSGNGGNNNKVYAGNGDNTIDLGDSDSNTVTTGSGKDTITMGADGKALGDNTITIGTYDEEQGEVTVQGGVENSVTVHGGNNVITINNTLVEEGKKNVITIKDNTSDKNTITVLGGHTEINAEGKAEIRTGAGDDVINLTNKDASNSIVNAGDGNNTITSEQFSATITTGSGTDTVTLSKSATVSTGDGADTVNLNDGNYTAYITAGKGDDTINLGENKIGGADIYFTKGDGHDTVKGLTSNGQLCIIIGDYDYLAKHNETNDRNLDLILYENGEETGDILTIENFWKENWTSDKDVVNTSISINNSYNLLSASNFYGPTNLVDLSKGQNGTNANDLIYGTNGDDTITTLDGYDRIRPGKGNDFIDIGTRSDYKDIYFDSGDGNLTVKINNTSTGVHIIMEDIKEDSTTFERHGVDMHVIRHLDETNKETLILQNAFGADDATSSDKKIYFYDKNFKELGRLYQVTKTLDVYPDATTGVLAGYSSATTNIYHTDSEENRIVIPKNSSASNVVYGQNEGTVDTLDLSWCQTSGYSGFEKEGDDLIITSAIDYTLDNPWVPENIVTTRVIDFYKEYNTVQNFEFKTETRTVAELGVRIRAVHYYTHEDDSKTLEGTWIQDYIAQNIYDTGEIGTITINSGGGNDEVVVDERVKVSATLNGGEGNDTLNAGDMVYGKAYLYGDSGNDILVGNKNETYFYGGTGNDTMDGQSSSQDRFYFSFGDGHDRVYGGSLNVAGNIGVDKIYVDGFADLDHIDLTHRFEGQNLILEYNYVDEVPQDSITIVDYIDAHGVINSPIKYINYGDGEGNWTGDQNIPAKWGIDARADEDHKTLVGTPFEDTLRGPNSNVAGVTMNAGTGDDKYYGGMYSTVVECSDFGGHDTIYMEQYGAASYVKFTDLDLADTDMYKAELDESGNMVISYANSGDDPTADGYVYPNSVTLYQFDSKYNPASGQYPPFNQLLGKDDTPATANPEYTVLKLYKNTVNVEGSGRADGTKYRDVITGSVAFNDIYAQYGDDIIYGSTGGDWAHGGAGDDLIDYSEIAQSSTLFGDTGNDTIYGSSEDDTIYGGSSSTASDNDGNDTIYGGAGVDSIYGGGGNDTIYGEDGNDHIEGGAGNDTIKGGYGNDELYGGAGDDELNGEEGDDTIYGGDGNDYIRDIYGTNNIWGGKGTDRISVIAGNNTVHFEDGDGVDHVFLYDGAGQNLRFDDQDYDDLNITADRANNYVNIKYGTGTDEVVIHEMIQHCKQVYITDQNDVKVNVRYSNNDGGNEGSNGKDALLGIAGANTFWGKQGDDQFFSGGTADTYRFSKGDGNDIIKVGSDGSNLKFEDLNLDDLNFTKDGNDLLVTYEGENSVRVEKYFSTGGHAFKFTTMDSTQYDVDNDGRNHINDVESATITGDEFFTNNIKINTANTTISGGNNFNFYTFDANVLADGVERTLNINNYATDTLTFKNWAGLTGLTTSVDGDDILITNGGVDPTIKIRITDGFKYKKPLTIEEYGVSPSETLLTYMENDHIWFDGSYGIDGTTNDDSVRVISSELVQTGGSAKGDSGSDLIVADRDGVQIATNNFASTESMRQDTTVGIVEDVILNGKTYTVYAQSETNNILSNNTESNDFYYSYINQKTNIDDKGGASDVFSLLNTWTGGSENEDGKYKIGTNINTNLFFRVDPDAYSVFDVELGTLSDMENAAQGNDHNGILIENNTVEKITTSDGFYISSTDIATLAQYAANWIESEGYTSYEDMATRGGSDILKDYVNVINKEADMQGYWSAPTP